MQTETQSSDITPARAGGLEGVVAADTRLSHVDGEAGRLVIAGYDVEALAGHASFEDLCAALWSAASTDTHTHTADPEALRRDLATARQRAWDQRDTWAIALRADNGMDALRAALALWESTGDDSADALAVTGAAAVIVAAWTRAHGGADPLAPDQRLDHATDYLRMSTGAAEPALAAALVAYLVTVMDHGMNASTFTARVIASTASDLVSAVVGAVGALKGPLHGGAPGPVLDMLDAIGTPERAADWIEGELKSQRRIMGMGHRIYRVRDPRAAVLEAALGRLEEAGTATPRLALARAVERAADSILANRYPDRSLKANVEFYTAVVLDAVGLPRTAFAPTFAVGRIAGWCAHVIEQRRTGRLIRPASRYVGEWPPQ